MMVSRPPKPPCWRDFIPEHTKSRSSRESTSLHFTDLSQVSNRATVSGLSGDIGTTGSHVTSLDTTQSLAHTHSSLRSNKKHRNRLHRTRSELSLEQAGDIPDVNLTVSLADTKPREFGMRGRTTFDPHVYINDNTRRCERWLEGVRASQPLDDVDFAQGAGVEVEIPDEEEGRASLSARSRPKHRHRRAGSRPAIQTGRKPEVDSIAESIELQGHVTRVRAGDRGRPPETSEADDDLLSLILTNLPQPSGHSTAPHSVHDGDSVSTPRLSDVAACVMTSEADCSVRSLPINS